MKKDLVLTIGLGYSYSKLDPFIRTLIKSGFEGDIVMFYDRISSRAVRELEKWGVKLVKFNSERFKQKKMILVNYRFSLFYDFLKKRPGRYKRIFITDVRDIVFQSNPSNYPRYRNLNFFLENKKIRDSESNSLTFKKLKGEVKFKKYNGNFIACAGTTIGDYKNIQEYLRKMIANISDPTSPLDQSLHNYLLYSKKFPNHKLFKNFQGPVLTIGDLSDRELLYNQKGQLINQDGSIIPLIHQYDRNTRLLRKFNLPFYFLLRYLDNEYINFKKVIKRLLFRVPLIGDSFKKKYYDPIISAKN